MVTSRVDTGKGDVSSCVARGQRQASYGLIWPLIDVSVEVSIIDRRFHMLDLKSCST